MTNAPIRIAKHLGFCLFDPARMGRGYKHRERFNNAVFISPNRDFLFTKNEKCASVTLRFSLQNAVVEKPLPRQFQNVDRWFLPLLQPSDLNLRRIADINSVPFKFAVVRNPYSRVLSLYLNSKAGRYGRSRMDRNMDFGSFVAYVTKQAPEEMNRHWRVQYYNIYCNVIRYDHFIKFENLEEELSRFLERFSKRPPEIRSVHKNQSRAGRRIAEYYTPEIAKRVRDTFAIDFEFFGYSTELPD